MGTFGVDKMVDFELLTYQEQVAIAEHETGLVTLRTEDDD
jgi:formate-dependent phosphoribosylglycinamide formyltransferase (GAR transformylase)